MAGSWDTPYAKEQVWVLREIQDAFNGQLSCYNSVGGDNAELSVALPLGAHEEQPRSTDPNVLISEKLHSLKVSVLEKVNLFIHYRLGCDLDFSSSLIREDVTVQEEIQLHNELFADRAEKLNLMAANCRSLGLPTALIQYSYLHVLCVGMLKYLNDLEYIRRVSTKKMPPLPQYDKDNKNRYDKLRYKFHRYKVQFMFATQHVAMERYKELRSIGKNIIDKTFEDINEKSMEFIKNYCQINTPNQTDSETNSDQVTALYKESFGHLKEQLSNFLQVFGIRMFSREEGSRLVPEELPAYWLGNNPATAAVRTESEDSMYLSGQDVGDEVSQSFPGEAPAPQSSGYYSDDSFSSDSDPEESNLGYYFLDNPLDHDWMYEPRVKRPRRGN